MFEPNGKCLFSASNDYMQSISWEPSELYDSVYCQWRAVNDVSISNNKLVSLNLNFCSHSIIIDFEFNFSYFLIKIASSFSQNMVSFYAVDLSVSTC